MALISTRAREALAAVALCLVASASAADSKVMTTIASRERLIIETRVDDKLPTFV